MGLVLVEERKDRERERRRAGVLRVAKNNSEGLREEQRTNVIVLDWEMEAMGQTYCYVNDSEVDNKEFSHEDSADNRRRRDRDQFSTQSTRPQ